MSPDLIALIDECYKPRRTFWLALTCVLAVAATFMLGGAYARIGHDPGVAVIMLLAPLVPLAVVWSAYQRASALERTRLYRTFSDSRSEIVGWKISRSGDAIGLAFRLADGDELRFQPLPIREAGAVEVLTRELPLV
jgi:hypothetical protein